MIYCRLIALKKCPGVRPIGIGDIFRLEMRQHEHVVQTNYVVAWRLVLKVVFITYVFMGKCLDNEDPWGVLLIDARNAFNEGNRKLMVWLARHEWPTGARFSFNMYRHHTIIVL